MKDIIAINGIFSSEEKREFVSFLKKKNRRGDAKNIDLYRMIDSGRLEDPDIQLYGKPSRNSFHALCKRLQDTMIDFVAERSFASETSEEMQIMKLLLASRIFFEHKLYKPAFKSLEKSEQRALTLDQYTLLSEIYHTKVQYAHLNTKEDFNTIANQAERNQRLQQRELKLNIAYASIKQNIRNASNSVKSIIEAAFDEFGISIDEALTYKSLYQLFQILATAGELRTDYASVLPYSKHIYTIVRKKQEQADKHLYYHIQILLLMAIVSFRNKDFENSISFTNQMEEEMKKQQGTYFKTFLNDLVLLKALNLNYSGESTDAIELLQEHANSSPHIQLALVMCLFQQLEYKEAWRALNKLQHSDRFYEKKVGFIWVIQRNIIEILLLIELDELDLVLSRLNNFQRRQFPRLKALEQTRAIGFMKLVSMYYDDPEQVTSEAFKEKVENSLEWRVATQEDIFVMSFYAWLKAKMEERDIYEVTLELVRME
ncbi:hypothetical protein J1N09_10335 [Aureitalea sp. L0-47]|uniref:hypothetical protein n=1 Tax=Aureitalea sp. L0-47 TaxID=2816962 RepID=UPI002238FA33|nr:hypothetical protein [Aureitalea sp. L0-47]MCW5520237.1 hypothetical protein [Aureitalea sp. L0-47]